MKPDQFTVCEHYSYDMMGTWFYAGSVDPRKNNYSIQRMEFFLHGTVSPLKCRYLFFPEYGFNAEEFAKR